MNDTTPDAAASLAALLRSRSGSDRVRIMSDMFRMARALVIASIKAEHPDIEEAELRVKVFARFYATGFTPSELAHITERLREASRTRPDTGGNDPYNTPMTTEPLEPLTGEERDRMRQWLRNWQIAGPMLEQERWNRVAALTEDEAWEESESLLQAWEPDMLGDEGEGLVLQQRVFARAGRKRVP